MTVKLLKQSYFNILMDNLVKTFICIKLEMQNQLLHICPKHARFICKYKKEYNSFKHKHKNSKIRFKIISSTHPRQCDLRLLVGVGDWVGEGGTPHGSPVDPRDCPARISN